MKYDYDFEDKKTVRLYTAFVISSFIFTGCWMWVLAEFILYLVKDDPFNWISFWSTIGVFIIAAYFMFKSLNSHTN